MKSDYRFTADGFLNKLADNYSSPFLGADTPEKINTVSEKLKSELGNLIKIDSVPLSVDVSCVKLKTVRRKGYSVETLKCEILDGFSMLCYVLIPDKITGDGIVCACGHGYGARQIIRQSKSGKYRTVNFIDNYQKNFGEALALDGHTVIVPEFIGFGESRLKADIHKPFYISSCDTVSHHLLLYGLSTAGIRIYQVIKCLDILEKEYGCSELGCMGISGGGLVTLYSACLDERIKKICVCGYINSFKSSVLSMWHCPDNYIPGIFETGDMCDFASSLAPRRLMMEYGTDDKLFPVDASRRAANFIKDIYSKTGCADNFVPVEFKGKHEVYMPSAIEFFK